MLIDEELVSFFNGVSPMLLTEFTFNDQTAVLLNPGTGGFSRKVFICSSCLPLDSLEPPPSAELESLVSFCKQNNFELLMGCDPNTHHLVWGSSDINVRGRALVEYRMTRELQILNRGSVPTFTTSRKEEVIDITFCTNSLVGKISGWRVSKEVSLSNHKHILFTLSGAQGSPITFRNSRTLTGDNIGCF
jgi:hypothetical protein